MDNLGVPLKVKQHRLGHSRAGDITTDVYTHYQIGDDAHIAERLGAVLSKEVLNSLPLTCPQQEGLPVGVQEALVNKQENGCGGLQCTETAILAVPFSYSLADALAA